MQMQTIRMTLTNGLKGRTIVLNRRQFINGVCEISAPQEEIGGLISYFQKSYQVKVSNVNTSEVEKVTEEDNHALREDDSEVMTENQKIDAEDGTNIPNARQSAIIDAINKISKDEWVEKDTNPHPKVKHVADLMADPTVTKAEICEVIGKWLS